MANLMYFLFVIPFGIYFYFADKMVAPKAKETQEELNKRKTKTKRLALIFFIASFVICFLKYTAEDMADTIQKQKQQEIELQKQQESLEDLKLDF